MAVGVVVVLAVAREAAEEDALVFAVPVVDGEHDEALVDAPGVGQGGDEARVDHVPQLAVVLLLLVEDAIERCAALAHGEGAEFGEDVWFLDATVGADGFDLGQYLFGHVFVVVVGGQAHFAGESAADVEGVEFGADALEVAVHIDALGQLVPVVGGVADAGIDEEVEHFEAELGVRLHLFLVERDDVVVADAEARGVEVELGLLFGGNADAELHGFQSVVEGAVEGVVFVLVVEDGDDVVEAVAEDAHDVFYVLVFLEAVADDDFVLVDEALRVQLLDEVDVECRRGFEVDVVFQCLLEDEGEVAALGAVAVVVRSAVVGLGDGYVEQTLGPLYL